MYDKVLILGATGLVGSNLYRRYNGLVNLPTIILAPNRAQLDLVNWRATIEYFFKHKPELVFLCAARVGGIKANNDHKADFITDNLKIQTNVMEACHLSDVRKLVFLGSSCIYPRDCSQPIKEEYLLTGPLEKTNDAYAIAKIAGIKMCQSYRQQYGSNFISVMPCNLYGPRDNFDLMSSHVLPALIRKFHEGKVHNEPRVDVWGTGNPLREFLYIEDLVDALIYLSQVYSDEEIINVGSGEEILIKDLVEIIKEITEYKGEIVFNANYPDGTMRKILDSSKINSKGWKPKISLKEGIKMTYEYYKEKYDGV